MANKQILVATHDGIFHADEVVACAVLQLAFADDDIHVVRTRNTSVLERADICVDVGGKYFPPTHFDHHQKDAPARSDGAPYSSAGMVWNYYGKQAIPRALQQDVAPEYHQYITDDIISDIWDKLDTEVFFGIDQGDNGIFNREVEDTEAALVSVINSHKPNWVSNPRAGDWTAGFNRAMDAVVDMLLSYIITAFGSNIATAASKESYKTTVAYGSRIAELPSGAIFPKANVLNNQAYDHVMLELFPDTDGSFRIRTVPVRADDRNRTPRLALPESWAGLDGALLQEVTGVPDATFCHKGRFIAGAKSYEGAIALADLALKELDI